MVLVELWSQLWLVVNAIMIYNLFLSVLIVTDIFNVMLINMAMI